MNHKRRVILLKTPEPVCSSIKHVADVTEHIIKQKWTTKKHFQKGIQGNSIINRRFLNGIMILIL